MPWLVTEAPYRAGVATACTTRHDVWHNNKDIIKSNCLFLSGQGFLLKNCALVQGKIYN